MKDRAEAALAAIAKCKDAVGVLTDKETRSIERQARRLAALTGRPERGIADMLLATAKGIRLEALCGDVERMVQDG